MARTCFIDNGGAHYLIGTCGQAAVLMKATGDTTMQSTRLWGCYYVVRDQNFERSGTPAKFLAL